MPTHSTTTTTKPTEQATATTTTPPPDLMAQGYDETEATNATIAELTATRYKDELCYVRSTTKEGARDRASGWLRRVHDDDNHPTIWTRDGAESFALKACETVIRGQLKVVAQEASQYDQLRERNRQYLNALNRLPAIRLVLASKMEARLSDFDTTLSELAIRNGVLNLATLELRPYTLDDRFLLQAPVSYAPKARAPRWETFVREALTPAYSGELGALTDGGDDGQESSAVIRYTQRALGYSLLGGNPEHCLFVAYGEGGNGKSVLLRSVANVLGGYAGDLTPEVLVSDYVRTGTSLLPELVAVRNTRLLISSEPKKGALNSHRVKNWTGETQTQMRTLYGEPELLPITFTLWLMTNQLPDLTEHTKAIKRRIHILYFPNDFTPVENLNLLGELAEERDGIFAWLVEGLRDYYATEKDSGGSKLRPPESVQQSARDWYESESVFERLFNGLWRRNSTKRLPWKEVKAGVTDYVAAHPEEFPRTACTDQFINQTLKDFGLTKKTVGGQVYVLGLEWNEGAQREDEQPAEFKSASRRDGPWWGATVGEMVWLYLHDWPTETGSTPHTIAEKLGISVNTVYRSLSRMEQAGYVARRERGYTPVPLYAFPPATKSDQMRRRVLRTFLLRWADERGGAGTVDSLGMMRDLTPQWRDDFAALAQAEPELFTVDAGRTHSVATPGTRQRRADERAREKQASDKESAAFLNWVAKQANSDTTQR